MSETVGRIAAIREQARKAGAAGRGRDPRPPTTSGGTTPQRAVRVSDGLWKDAQDAAEWRGENVSHVINRALAQYVRDTAKRQAALERIERIRASIPPEQRLSEDEAQQLLAEEKAAMRAESRTSRAD